jgi:hypothetical protein
VSIEGPVVTVKRDSVVFVIELELIEGPVATVKQDSTVSAIRLELIEEQD